MQIVCKDLAVGYGNFPVREHISFSIPAGSYTCVVGENGIGKSTLIKTLLGLLPPVSGTITMGHQLKSTDIGYLPQQTQIQRDFPASVFEVVRSGCLNKMGLRPFYNREEKALTHQMLDKLGIDHLSKKSYSQLSGGQQQRVLLARALCATNKILLLDEPTAGLDPATTSDFYKLVKGLHQEGITIIMITHDLDDALPDADYILSLSQSSVDYIKKDEFMEGGGCTCSISKH